MLAKSPGYTIVAILTLALGIGATTAIFSAVFPVLFDSLPYRDAGRLVMIWDIFKGERSAVTFNTYREVAARSHDLGEVAAMDIWQPTVTGPTEPERLSGQRVSAGYFHVLGVRPSIGRDFLWSDDLHGGGKSVILGDRLWRRRFAADPAVLGRRVMLDGDGFTVIGVMPRRFENLLQPSAEIWTTLQYDSANVMNFQTMEWGHHMHMVGRLQAGSTVLAARRELEQMARTPVAQYPRAPWALLSHGLMVNPLQQEITRGVKPALLAVSGAVTLLLLIACVNLTNLVLARSVQRRGEFAMRAALGAARGRLIRQLLTESLLLALLGGIGGLMAAQAGLSTIVELSPPELPRIANIEINGEVFVFAVCVSGLMGLLVGLAPAIDTSRADLRSGVQRLTRQASAWQPGMRRMLVIAEVALALVLLVGAGLLVRSVEHLFAIAPGFSPTHLLTMQVQTSGHLFDDDATGQGASRRIQFFTQALEKVQRVPGVESAAFTSLLPFSDDPSGTYGASFEVDQPGGAENVFRYVVSAGYFEAMRIPLLRGRFLDDRDQSGRLSAVVISESLARSEFGKEDPIGKRVHVGPVDWPWYNVVGVVGDVKQTSLAASDPNAVYLTSAQSWFADDAMTLVVRVRGDHPEALSGVMRDAIWSVNKNQPILRTVTMEELVKVSVAQQHFALVLFELFGTVALLLSALGLYGVLANSINERTKEFGIRLALGARNESILRLVIQEGLALAIVGSGIGILVAIAASRVLASLLFGVARLDPLTYGGVILLLLTVSAVACWMPARRAARVDPITAIRSE